MSAEAFFDSNVLIHSLERETEKAAKARAALLDGGVISIQVLNECTNVMLRKLRWGWPDIRAALTDFQAVLGPPRPITIQTHSAALDVAERNKLSMYDALIVASALDAGCSTLLSEDMQHGRVISDRLTIRNPFAA